MADSSLGRLFVELFVKDEKFKKQVDDAKKQLKEVGSAWGSLSSQVKDLAGGALKVGAVAFGAIAGAMTAAAIVGAEFEQKMKTVGVIAGATGTEFDLLTAKARELGATTQYSASEAADAMQLLASAGLSTNDILAATGNVLSLAGAGGTDLSTAAAAVTSTMAQFGLVAEDAGRIADVFAQSTAMSQFGVEDLSQALAYAGTTGAGFGMSLEETVAALAQFRDQGLAGTAAGTAFRAAMVQATRDTDTTVAALKKYDLTMKDINPELHSFEEIMRTVGERGMLTTDIITVFGTEAGGAIASISSKFADGTSTYSAMLADLESSTGAATAMFADMTDTTLGKWGEVQSGIEEVLLTLFDFFKGPLKELLGEVAAMIAAVSEELQSRSGEISGSFDGALGGISAWLMENRTMIAQMIADFVEGSARLAEVFVSIIPLLDEIAIGAGTIVATFKVYQLVTGVVGLIKALSALNWSIRGVMATISASTGGIYALVAAIGVLVTGIIVLVSRMREAESATTKFQEAQEKLTQESIRNARAQKQRAGELLEQTQEMLNQKYAELEASGQLTDALREERVYMSGLTAETAAAAIAAGDLVETSNGLRTVSSIMADLGNPENQQAFKDLSAHMQTLSEKVKTSSSEIKLMQYHLEGAVSRGETTLGWAADELAGLNVGDAKARLIAMKKEAKQAADELAALRKQVTQGQQESSQQDVKIVQRTEAEKEALVSRAEDGMKEKRESARQQSLGAIEALRDALFEATHSELEVVEHRYARAVEAAEEAAAEEAAIEGQSATTLAEIAQRLQDQKLLLREQADIEIAALDKAAREKAEEDAREEQATLARSLDALLSLRRGSYTDVQNLELDKAEWLAENANLSGADLAEAAALWDARIAEAMDQEQRDARDAMLEDTTKLGRAWAALGARASRALQAMGEAVSKPARGTGALSRAVQGLIEKARPLAEKVGSAFKKVRDGAAELAGKGRQAISDFIGKNAGLQAVAIMADDVGKRVGKFVRGLVNATIAGAGAFGVAVVRIAQATAATVRSIGNVLSGISGAISGVIDFVSGGLERLTGFSFDLIDSVRSVLDMVSEAEAEAAASGRGRNARGVAGGIAPGTDPKATAVEFVDGLVSESVDFFAAIVDLAPTLINELITRLPELIMALVEGIGPLIQTLVAAFDDLLIMIIDMVDDVVIGFANALDDLIAGIISSLPNLLVELPKAILAMLPDLITRLIAGAFEIVTAVITMLPTVITNLLDSIPLIIEAVVLALAVELPKAILVLVQAVPQIIIAVVESVPHIIASVVKSVPEIVVAFIRLIPDLIIAIADSLPELIPAIVGMIPIIIIELLKATPQIVDSLLSALWEGIILRLPEIALSIVTGIWEAIKASVSTFVDLVGQIFKAAWEAIVNIFGGNKDKKEKGGSSAYSGIDYVPATMRVTVHPGEAVVPANRNAARSPGGHNPPLAGYQSGFMTAGAGAVTVPIAIFADGALVDQTLVRATAQGRATQVAKMMRRTAGVRVGMWRGRYNKWSK